MKRLKIISGLLICIMLFLSVFSNYETFAEDIPGLRESIFGDSVTVEAEMINNNTEVSITFSGSKKAKAYFIILSGEADLYKSIEIYKNGKVKKELYSEERLNELYDKYEEGVYLEYNKNDVLNWPIAYIKDDGSKDYNYIAKGLKKGSYIIRVAVIDKKGVLNYCSNVFKIDVPEVSSDKENKNTKYNFSKVKSGDIIKFGSYEQNGIVADGAEDIEWIVLSKSKKELVLVSRYVLDFLEIKSDNEKGWVDSNLRSWLNLQFYNTAFNKTERKIIAGISGAVKDIDKNKEKYKDNVSILSDKDIINTKYGFNKNAKSADGKRTCGMTEYAAQQSRCMIDGISMKELKSFTGLPKILDDSIEYSDKTCAYWVISSDTETVKYVNTSGKVVSKDHSFGSNYEIIYGVGVRPVIKVSI